MVLHFQTRVVRGESAVLAAKENIKTVLMEQTSGRKLTCTKKFVVGVLKSTLQTSTQWEEQTAECILHEGERSGVLWGTLSKAQMDSTRCQSPQIFTTEIMFNNFHYRLWLVWIFLCLIPFPVWVQFIFLKNETYSLSNRYNQIFMTIKISINQCGYSFIYTAYI